MGYNIAWCLYWYCFKGWKLKVFPNVCILLLIRGEDARINMQINVIVSLICLSLTPHAVQPRLVLNHSGLTAVIHARVNIRSFCILHINKTIHLGERNVFNWKRGRLPHAGLIYASLTLHRARRKSPANHFALGAHPRAQLGSWNTLFRYCDQVI